MDDQPIVITGFMGSGKTRAARALGRLLNRAAIDLDEEITRLKGRTPAKLITIHGEEAFRELETDVLQQIVDQGAKIIALGGGAWIVPHNRVLLTARDCLTIWLDLEFESCWKRITESGGNRPLAPNRQQAKALYEVRKPVYQLADLRIETTDKMGANEVAERMAEAIGNIKTS